ncbi:serpin family protein [Gimesia panareensis]|uniref:Serpin (Serine protease inhibitor) n=1 Tax=Gimesia panareensis TaxID=2527978 RepID=A0A517QB74_9PLAN|nr:serpin family protein [Gimesia panareensis]QDT28884.1 Serpin (serine protease inhibitor) [Gimesia panareensis]QDU51731.1 Serpin (serine protease inhibitor) [Gimesia panareensis]
MEQKREISDEQRYCEMRATVDDCNRFACALFQQLAAENSGNLFFSPASISTALAMTLAGARGETAREMRNALQLTQEGSRLHASFQRLRSETRTGGVELDVANQLWGQAGYHFLAPFLETVRDCYGGGLQTVDFQGEPAAAADQINEWVSQATRGKITELVSPMSFNELTRLILVNAIYFKGAWEDEFEPERTRDQTFYLAGDQQTSVPMMHQTGSFGYFENETLQVLELPYRQRDVAMQLVKHDDGSVEVLQEEIPGGGSDFSMCILLPRERDGLSTLEQEIQQITLQKWLNMDYQEVIVSLPRFRLEKEYDLNAPLESLGVKQAFQPKAADFFGMSDDPEGLFIGSVLHKTFVEVNEQGTEAAALTEMIMVGGCARDEEPPKVFCADHPFLFLIRDRQTGWIYFMGRFNQPE